jgi:hypothetical protein
LARTSLAGAALGLGVVSAPRVAAQQPCPAGVVTQVTVESRSIFGAAELDADGRYRWAQRLANDLHVRTREAFIRSELLLREGDCYDPVRLAESERLLRAYPFISRAEVSGARRPDGGWEIGVVTQDEWTTRLSVQGSATGGPRIERVGVTEQNLVGLGILIGGSIRTVNDHLDVAGRIELPRLLGTRTDAALRWAHTADGGHLIQSLSYPFLAEIGRLAASESWMRREGTFAYATGRTENDSSGSVLALHLPFEQERIEITLAARLGTPGNLTVFGLGFSNHTLDFPAFPTRLELDVNGGLGRQPADSTAAALVRHQTTHSEGTRLNLMVAQRNVRYRLFRGLDALRGTRDVPLGLHVSLLVGRRVGTFSSERDQPDDLHGAVRGEWSGATRSVLVLAAGGVDARQIYAGGQRGKGWKDVLAELATLVYWQPARLPSHTFVLRAAGAGGWSVSQPFQLTVGGPAGVRGYERNELPGGRRIVLNLEDRIYLGWPHPDLVDLGLTLLADAGKMWAGDAPYGAETGWVAALGAGIRVGFPAGSQRVGRVDVLWPLPARRGGGLMLRGSIGDPIGLSAGLADRQLERTRVDVGPDRFMEHLR